VAKPRMPAANVAKPRMPAGRMCKHECSEAANALWANACG
jgi:hypothetical protein